MFVFGQFTLSKVEVDLFKQGIKYCPNSSSFLSPLIIDTANLARKLRLSDYHNSKKKHNLNNIVDTSLIYCPNKNADINVNNNIFLETNIHELINVLNNIKTNTVITKEEHTIKKLSTRMKKENYVLTKSDKGSNFVFLHTELYNTLINKHLLDTNTYEETGEPLESQIHEQIVLLCDNYKDNLTPKEYKYLCTEDWKFNYFYILPKLHKLKDLPNKLKEGELYIQINPTPNDLNSRPIVSTINGVTSKLSKLLDEVLKPYLKLIPSYIKDSYDFLNKLNKDITDDSITLATWDIVSLYTKIPNELGIEAIKYWLTYKQHLERISNNFIINALRIILNFNTFIWNNKHFKQKSGVAMGVKLAPTYAILTIGFLEQKFYDICTIRLGPTIGDYIKVNFFRFIDDCFLVWKNDFGDINQVSDILNDLNVNISFTHSFNSKEIPFLDILIYKKDNKLETDIYKKPTDSDQILSFYSHHPRHSIRNIPYVLTRRIFSITSENERIKENLKNLKIRLLKAKYPIKLIDDAMKCNYEFSSKKIENLKEMYPISISYNKNTSNTINKLRHNVLTLNNLTPTKHIIGNKKLCIAYKSSPNLLQTINNYSSPKIRCCNEPRCKTCKLLFGNYCIKLPNRTPIYPNKNMNCKSNNVIYCLICTNCEKLYVGQTSLPLRQRMTLHRQHNTFPEYAILNCNRHFYSCSKEFKVAPLFQIVDCTVSKLLFIERYFINRIKPELNSI